MSAFLDTLRNPSITNEPPTSAEQRRNDRYVIGLIIVAILLGWLFRNSTVNAVEEISFENGIPAITVPANWIMSRGDEVLLTAIDPASASTFDARVEVFARPLQEDEDLNLISISWPLQRSQQLDRFRTLNSVAVVGPNAEPALLITYAYIADPTRESGALGMPVVVRGQDLLYLTGEENQRQLVVVTTAADAAEWQDEAAIFQRIRNRLGVEEQE
jgi:hypothetical protein